jgi:hypothetical protein
MKPYLIQGELNRNPVFNEFETNAIARILVSNEYGAEAAYVAFHTSTEIITST